MQKSIQNTWLLPVLSGLLIFFAVCHVQFFLAWICFAPLFISVKDGNAKAAAKKSFITGAVFSCFAYSWMIPGAERFTGSSILYGIAVFVFAVILFSSWMALVNAAIAFIKNKKQKRSSVYINAMLAGAVFAAGEALLQLIADGMPWFHFNAGLAVSRNVYAIQPASFGGVYMLSFFAVAINYLVAEFAAEKKWKLLFIPLSITGVYLLGSYIMLLLYENSLPKQRKFSVAILSENILPDIKWDDNNGNMLVEKLLQLSKDAVEEKPGIALWSESVVPWTYQPGDDFVNEVLKTTSAAQITHIMGINTEIKNNEVYNSAYCILPDGKINGRYDKQHLLSLIEKPVGSIIFPFLSSAGFEAKEESSYNAPLATKFGNAGILICNESTLATVAADAVNRGANFLCVMGNDGWFSNTYIPEVHFYNARLRAVETRKDVVINCNNGISGLVQSSGNIAAQQSGDEPFVKTVAVQRNSFTTAASSSPLWFVYVCVGFIAVMIAVKFFLK